VIPIVRIEVLGCGSIRAATAAARRSTGLQPTGRTAGRARLTRRVRSTVGHTRVRRVGARQRRAWRPGRLTAVHRTAHALVLQISLIAHLDSSDPLPLHAAVHGVVQEPSLG
jgi:hypothetical protein